MRAHINPTRMEVIIELADFFAKRLATPCPLCYNPGWGVVDTQKGLECEMCGSETEMVKSKPKQYGWDFLVAATAALYPWHFC